MKKLERSRSISARRVATLSPESLARVGGGTATPSSDNDETRIMEVDPAAPAPTLP